MHALSSRQPTHKSWRQELTCQGRGWVNNYYVLKSICGMSSASHLCSSGQFRPVPTGCNHAIAFLRIHGLPESTFTPFSSIPCWFVVSSYRNSEAGFSFIFKMISEMQPNHTSKPKKKKCHCRRPWSSWWPSWLYQIVYRDHKLLLLHHHQHHHLQQLLLLLHRHYQKHWRNLRPRLRLFVIFILLLLF